MLNVVEKQEGAFLPTVESSLSSSSLPEENAVSSQACPKQSAESERFQCRPDTITIPSPPLLLREQLGSAARTSGSRRKLIPLNDIAACLRKEAIARRNLPSDQLGKEPSRRRKRRKRTKEKPNSRCEGNRGRSLVSYADLEEDEVLHKRDEPKRQPKKALESQRCGQREEDSTELGEVTLTMKQTEDSCLSKKLPRVSKRRRRKVEQGVQEEEDNVIRIKTRSAQTECKFWLDGRCHKGNECPFSHSVAPRKHDELCKFHLGGACLKGTDCLYSHDLKAQPCQFYQLAKCQLGEDCRFGHFLSSSLPGDEKAGSRSAAEPSDVSHSSLISAEHQ